MQAVLALADGAQFYGRALGHFGIATGEVVFNTALSGYQEILTDPSYAGQLVTLTMAEVGNVGCNPGDMEHPRPLAAGLIVRNAAKVWSNWRGKVGLDDFLKQHRVVAISAVDTRRLTRHLRDHGTMPGCIVSGEEPERAAAEALHRARGLPEMAGQNLAREVTTRQPYRWHESAWDLDAGKPAAAPAARRHVVAYDFGIKRNILRLLIAAGCDVTVVPATTPADDVLAVKPDGVFLSNGPGDPAACSEAIAAIRTLLAHRLPLFGICLGHQLLALASGARTVKMHFGHHGANHPVRELATGRVWITSQNHGFVVADEGLAATLEVTHRSLFDGTIQGIRRRDCPAFGFQGHPEASPGPHDAQGLFGEFIELMAGDRRHA